MERAGDWGAAADLRVRGAGHVRLLPRLRPRQDAAGLQEGPALPPLRHAGHGRHPRHTRQAKCIKEIISRDVCISSMHYGFKFFACFYELNYQF